MITHDKYMYSIRNCTASLHSGTMEGEGRGVCATKTHIVGYSPTNVSCQQTNNQKLEAKCALFCITAFMQDEYYVIRLGNQNFEASHSHGYQPVWAFVFQVLPSLPPSPLPLYHYAGR